LFFHKFHTHWVVIGPLGQTFASLIIKSVNSRPIVGEVVNTARWKVYPSIRDASENDFIWDV